MSTLEAEDRLAAIALAIVGAGDSEVAVKVISAIISPVSFEPGRTEPTKILLDAISEVGTT